MYKRSRTEYRDHRGASLCTRYGPTERSQLSFVGPGRGLRATLPTRNVLYAERYLPAARDPGYTEQEGLAWRKPASLRRGNLPTHRPLIGQNRQTIVLTLLLIVTLVGGVLRFARIGNNSLWIDEAFSVWIARRPVPEILSRLIRFDQHPPLYYLLLRLCMQIGDRLRTTTTPQSGAAWARALSALSSTLNIPVLYALGKRLVNRRVGLLAALVLALSPFHVYLAQEARMYALLCLNVSLALLGLVDLDPLLNPPRLPGRRTPLPASGGGLGRGPDSLPGRTAEGPTADVSIGRSRRGEGQPGQFTSCSPPPPSGPTTRPSFFLSPPTCSSLALC